MILLETKKMEEHGHIHDALDIKSTEERAATVQMLWIATKVSVEMILQHPHDDENINKIIKVLDYHFKQADEELKTVISAAELEKWRGVNGHDK